MAGLLMTVASQTSLLGVGGSGGGPGYSSTLRVDFLSQTFQNKSKLRLKSLLADTLFNTQEGQCFSLTSRKANSGRCFGGIRV
ncbi:hypothetical protein EYF80_017373 [Liparis tanakae]|uniref:Uncharacterized protein n=1 Tax=Liparis tanakae TaxID=230148 RepID=A0A4Z2I387_9TELE|nr:hypothetical protein EYF80_017373 [Liparis tanakae]